MLRETLGPLLRAAREQRGLSLRNAATVIGTSPSYLSEVERSEKDPSSEMLLDILISYSLEIHVSLTDHDGNPVQPAPKPKKKQGRPVQKKVSPQGLTIRDRMLKIVAEGKAG